MTQFSAEMTKGEAIIVGLEQIREGLQMVRQASRDVDLIRTLVGSNRASQQLREIMSGGLLKTVVIEMVHTRNYRLSQDTVEKVISDFMAVLFELSKPFDPSKAADSSSARGGIGE